MRRPLRVTSCLLLVTILLTVTGCAKLKQFTRPITKPITKVVGTVGAVGGAILPPYASPKAKITVLGFANNTAKGSVEIGLALRKTLVESLVNTNRFILSEPNAKVADLSIAVVLSEFDPRVSGGKAGIGGGGGTGNATFGGLLGVSLNKANIAFDIQIVSVTTQEVLAVSHIRGQASDSTSSIKWQDARLSAYNNTPMGKAIRLCLTESARYIIHGIPAKYYKYY